MPARGRRVWRAVDGEAVQGIARDLFIEGMQRLEAAGYGIVLHAHDEAVAEVPEDFGSVHEFLRIFTAYPAWAKACRSQRRRGTREPWCRSSGRRRLGARTTG